MVTLAILAGGRSQRMGRDKALTPFLGRPLVCRVWDRLARLADETLFVADASGEILTLGPRVVPDLLPARGPLGGLYTALASASHPAVIVVGCDMPFINADLIEHALHILASENADAVVPSSTDGLEPLHAVYRREACLPAVRASLERGERRAVAWFPQANVRILTPEETAVFDPDGIAFFNANTPEELAQAAQWAADGGPGFDVILPG
ncbi:MAG: molybdopterin-guanine dinucleotide biosynthesis protein A [Anaerolineaceae bacterium]|nr:MAG: molybdopterin-guanine dinucleotide biosynthesis protein A [Anaerolineaceae bacterium]